MKNIEVVNSLNSISENVKELSGVIKNINQIHWWNTQWFSALVGAVSAIVITAIFEGWKNRKNKLEEFYSWFLGQYSFSSPSSLLSVAGHTSYACTVTENGKTTTIPEKAIAEKMVIEYRRHVKHWYLPFSEVRHWLTIYEKMLTKIPDLKGYPEIKNSKEYLEAEIFFNKIIEKIKNKTGENDWTI
jgi:hypothetical protein